MGRRKSYTVKNVSYEECSSIEQNGPMSMKESFGFYVFSKTKQKTTPLCHLHHFISTY